MSEQCSTTKGETWDGLEPALLAAMPLRLWQSGSLITLNLACLKPMQCYQLQQSPDFTYNVLFTLEVDEGSRVFLLISVSPARMSFRRHTLCCHKQISCVALQTAQTQKAKQTKVKERLYSSLSLCCQTPGLMSRFAPDHQAGCSVPSATRAIKQKTVERKHNTAQKDS